MLISIKYSDVVESVSFIMTGMCYFLHITICSLLKWTCDTFILSSQSKQLPFLNHQNTMVEFVKAMLYWLLSYILKRIYKVLKWKLLKIINVAGSSLSFNWKEYCWEIINVSLCYEKVLVSCLINVVWTASIKKHLKKFPKWKLENTQTTKDTFIFSFHLFLVKNSFFIY